MLVFIAPSVQRCDCQGAFLLVKDWGWVEEQRRKSRNKGVDMKPRASSICADGGGQKRRSGVTVLFQRRPYPPTMLARDAIWLGPAGRQNHRIATCSPTDSPCNRSHASLFLFMQDPFTKRSLSSQWTLPHRSRNLSIASFGNSISSHNNNYPYNEECLHNKNEFPLFPRKPHPNPPHLRLPPVIWPEEDQGSVTGFRCWNRSRCSPSWSPN